MLESIDLGLYIKKYDSVIILEVFNDTSGSR